MYFMYFIHKLDKQAHGVKIVGQYWVKVTVGKLITWLLNEQLVWSITLMQTQNNQDKKLIWKKQHFIQTSNLLLIVLSKVF